MNEQEIKKILQELYALQPDLAVREQELKKIKKEIRSVPRIISQNKIPKLPIHVVINGC